MSLTRNSGLACRPRWRWTSAAAAICIQVGVTVVVPVVDAALARGATVVHVESQGNPTCPGGHNHSACQLCRTITMAAAVGATVVVHQRQTEVVLLVREPSALPALRRQASLGARGPPLS